MSVAAFKRALTSGTMGCCFMCALPVMTVRLDRDRFAEGEMRVQTVVRKHVAVPALPRQSSVLGGGNESLPVDTVTTRVSPLSVHLNVAAN